MSAPLNHRRGETLTAHAGTGPGPGCGAKRPRDGRIGSWRWGGSWGSALGAGAVGCLLLTAHAAAVDIRWAVTSNRIYVTGPGTVTLTQIKATQDQAPLDQVSAGVWILRANMVVEDGAQLNLHGTAAGGDVDQLRLQSNNTGASNDFVFVTADWGTIDIRNTAITSWDDTAGGPDTEYATHGRAYVSVRSKLADDGVTPLESRMDIADSEISYLGYDGPESYGLTWKVIGDQPGLLDRVEVRGDILRSHIHHNYFGVYTFGGHQMQWRENEVAYNVQYGFDPHDDSDELLIEGNNAHHNGNHGIIASKRCDHLTIRNNVSWSNGQNGIILHRSSSDCLVEGNQCYDNGDTGIVITGSDRTVVRSNVLVRNFEAGIRLDLGSADNLVESNECASNQWYGLYFYKSLDSPEPGDDGRPKRNQFVGNSVHDNGKEGIFLADSDDITFSGNAFYSNGGMLHFERGFRNRLDGNSIPADVTVLTLGSQFDATTTYVSHQPALRVQVDPYASTIFEDAQGRIFDPDEKGVATAVSTNGSTLVLTAAEIGTTSTVIARDLWAAAGQGTAWITPIGWTNPPAAGRQWFARLESAGQTLSFRVGALATNGTYAVQRDGNLLTTLNSDATGTLDFSDSPQTTNAVLYSVSAGTGAGSGLRVERSADALVVSWTEGVLQRATSLSPPDWQDLPATNGQVRIPWNEAQPMELFRVFKP